VRLRARLQPALPAPAPAPAAEVETCGSGHGMAVFGKKGKTKVGE
jgi:hypothetical protein